MKSNMKEKNDNVRKTVDRWDGYGQGQLSKDAFKGH